MNTLGRDVMAEISSIINEIESNPSIEAGVLISGKPGCFIAGADISMFETCKTKEEITALSKSGKYFFYIYFNASHYS